MRKVTDIQVLFFVYLLYFSRAGQMFEDTIKVFFEMRLDYILKKTI